MEQRNEYVQPIVLLVDRDNPSSAVDAIRAVAVASVSMFARDLHLPDEVAVWRLWLDGPFTKSVRRADRTAFERTIGHSALMETTLVKKGGAEALAFRPLIASTMPKHLSRLQVSGTELPDRPAAATAGASPTVILNSGLGMSTGKAAAQAAHALFLWFLNSDTTANAEDIDCTVRFADAGEFAELLDRSGSQSCIVDAGRTEIEPGSATAFTM